MKKERDKLISDLQSVVEDVEKLVQASSNELIFDRIGSANNKLHKGLNRLKDRGHDVRNFAEDGLGDFGGKIKKSPLIAAGICLGVGLLVGYLSKD